MQLTIAVPLHGNVSVSAWFYNHINHSVGVTDSLWYKISIGIPDCVADDNLGAWDIDSALPTAPYSGQLSPQRTFEVDTGTPTFYLNQQMMAGQDIGDLFVRGNMVAVFYPS